LGFKIVYLNAKNGQYDRNMQHILTKLIKLYCGWRQHVC